MKSYRPPILFFALLLLIHACEERNENPSAEPRFKTQQILVGRSLEPPQGFAYSARTLDGNVVLVVNKKDPAAPDAMKEDMYVEKYSSDGLQVWSKRYSSQFGIRVPSVFQASDGSLLVTANRRKSFVFGDEDLLLMRLSPDGDEIWSKTYASDLQRTPVQVIELTSGEIIIDIEASPHGYILRLDASGDEIGRIEKLGLGCASGRRFNVAPDGDFTIGSPNAAKISTEGLIRFCQEVFFYSCADPIFAGETLKAQDPDNYFMLGSIFTPVAPSGDCTRNERSDLFVTRFDGNGSPVATQTIDLAFNDYAQDLDFTSDNGIILLSEGAAANSPFESKAYLVKLRPDLSKVWSEQLNFSVGGFNQPLSIHTIDNGKYAVLLNTQNTSLNVHEIKLVFLTEQK